MSSHPAIKVRVSFACPSCAVRHVVDLEEVPDAKKPGMYPATGGRDKVTTRESWLYRCTNCGVSGAAQAPDVPLTELMGRPIGSCGHSALTDHYPGTGHDTTVCPGCCASCQAARDRLQRPAD